MTLQLHLEAGSADWDGTVVTEDRYVILNEDGMVGIPEHFTLEEAKDLIL